MVLITTRDVMTICTESGSGRAAFSQAVMPPRNQHGRGVQRHTAAVANPAVLHKLHRQLDRAGRQTGRQTCTWEGCQTGRQGGREEGRSAGARHGGKLSAWFRGPACMGVSPSHVSM